MTSELEPDNHRLWDEEARARKQQFEATDGDDPGLAVIMLIAKVWMNTGIKIDEASILTGLSHSRIKYFMNKYGSEIYNLAVS